VSTAVWHGQDYYVVKCLRTTIGAAEYHPTHQLLCEQSMQVGSGILGHIPENPLVPSKRLNDYVRYISKVPECSERGDPCLFASLHDFGVPNVIRSDEDDFGIPIVIHLLQNLHRIWSTPSLFTIP